MAYPAPEDYRSWQEYARALVAVLSEGSEDPAVFSYAGRVPDPPPVVIPPPNPSFPPEGFFPVWYSQAEAEMYLGNVAFSPPPAAALFNIDTAQLMDAAVSTSKIANLAVDTGKLANLAVEAAKLADSAVTETKIANLAVGSAAIQALAVGTAHIANAAIIAAKIGDLQVVTAKIADLAVNDAKIANLAVTSAKIANLAVGSAHIQDLAVTNGKIAALAVGTANMQDAAIVNAKIGDTITSHNWNPATKAGWSIDKNGNIIGQSIAIYDGGGNLVFGSGGTIDWSHITNVQLAINATPGQIQLLSQAGTLDTVNLSDAAIAAFAYINQITAANASTYIASAAINTAQIGIAAITTALIADAAIIRAKISDLAVGTAQIDNLAVSTAKIQDLAVTQGKIGYAAIGVAEIQDGSITNAKIATAAITSAKIGDLEVNNAKIANLTVGTEKIQYAAVNQVATFYSSYMGMPAGSTGYWYSLAYGGAVAQVSVTCTTPNQQTIVDAVLSLYRGGSSDDNLHFRCVRHDGYVLPQQYMNTRIVTGNMPYSFKFVDPAPGAGVTWTYTLQYYSTNDFPQFGDTTVTAMLVKR